MNSLIPVKGLKNISHFLTKFNLVMYISVNELWSMNDTALPTNASCDLIV